MSSVPQEINFPKESSQFFGGFFILMYYIQGIYNIYICTHLLILGFGGGPVGQPSMDPNGKSSESAQATSFNRTL